MKRGHFSPVILAAGLILPTWAAHAQSSGNANQKAGQATSGTSSTTAPTVVKEAAGTIHYDIYDIIDKSSATVTFNQGKSDLSDAEKKKLQEFVTKMQAEAPVEKFVVAAWADADYPPTGESLPKEAKKLADERAKKVEDALKQAGANKVDAYEMTKRPNWFQKAFSTETAEVKGAARHEPWTDEVMLKVGDKLRTKGGPGKVAVVARFKGTVSAH